MLSRPMKRILVTGSVGQIGSELTIELRRLYGNESVIAAGHKTQPSEELRESGPFHFIDVQERKELERIVRQYDIDTIYNMAAILSAAGEKNPQLCWDVNVKGFMNVLEVARENELARVINPSSIAVFGAQTPRDNTPTDTILQPTTMYGVTKVEGELLGDYYFHRFGLDVRGVRLPGVISYKTLPTGGTTDYAVAIFYEAIRHKRYKCFVREDTVLPMMYMPDALKALIDLANVPIEKLKHHCNFNVGAMSFSAGELAAEIKKRIPEFEVTYEPDFRQAIADSWPRSIDDSVAREEWGWSPEYSMERMTEDMIEKLTEKLLG